MSTQTRRCALQLGMAALASGAAGPDPPSATLAVPASEDIELLRLASLWQAVDRDLEGLYELRITMEIEKQTQAEVDRLSDHQLRIEDEIEAYLPPKTKEGATMIAKLVLDAVDRSESNFHCLREVCNHMAWDALAVLCCAESRRMCGMWEAIGQTADKS